MNGVVHPQLGSRKQAASQIEFIAELRDRLAGGRGAGSGAAAPACAWGHPGGCAGVGEGVGLGADYPQLKKSPPQVNSLF